MSATYPVPHASNPSPILGRAILLLIGCTIAVTAHADADTYAQVVRSTAWIVTSNADNETATGTGVLVDAEKRIVLTNAHVVGDSRTAVVFFADIKDGIPNVKRKHYLDNVLTLAQPGKVVAVDRRRDLALIQLPKVPEDVTAIELADSSSKPGSTIELVGNPGNSDVMWVSTTGSVRAVYDKKFKSNHGEHDFRAVETQSPIQPGDSGGPIVNADGKLVALAQSFSPANTLISFCVDVFEIRAMLASSWKTAPIASKKLLEDAGIEHSVNATGHYQIEHKIAAETTQTVYVAKDTEYFQRADVRKVWSLVQVSKEEPTATLMNRLLRQSSVTKIGAWAIEKNSDGDFLVLYVAKLDATAPDEAIKGTIEYVARIAAAMAKELNPKASSKTSAETLASWLAQ
ncbi:Periplasmic serine endoprotease DegP precursor [Rubripirellula lacrimiformis]|uniref:Periplasmic serine endoprotease DegP n=1 Tax=Rubripirellula lacrimiformis TaxID=1930273 RepID=A0A517N5W5_9BACT|nr:serine protease [Rubripirellula lacrimiformis]QDT02501.1 Periplasmic serine endoprotease DegP precursor [Rubripirellula lacrimiformis]